MLARRAQVRRRTLMILSYALGAGKIHHLDYPPVNKHSNGISPCSTGNTSSIGGFSIAMLDYRSVPGITKRAKLVCFLQQKLAIAWGGCFF